MKQSSIELFMKFNLYYKKIFFILIFFLIANFSFAQSLRLKPIVTCTDAKTCTWQKFSGALETLVSDIVILSYWVAVLLVTVGAFLVMFHGPSESLYRRGVEMIKVAIWGYILVLLSGIIFDIILEFFGPIKFANINSNLVSFVFAADSNSVPLPMQWYNSLKNQVLSELKCGGGATSNLDKLFNCLFEAIGLLKNIAVIFLALAIIVSAGYLISVPLFGLKNISKAYQILIWSIIGLVIILLSDLIKAQIERIVK